MIVEDTRSAGLEEDRAPTAFMIAFVCLILFPFLVVISISLRQGNFTDRLALARASNA